MGQNNQDINSCICSQLIYNKRAKNIQWGKDSIFNKVLGKPDRYTQKYDMGPLTHTRKLTQNECKT